MWPEQVGRWTAWMGVLRLCRMSEQPCSQIKISGVLVRPRTSPVKLNQTTLVPFQAILHRH